MSGKFAGGNLFDNFWRVELTWRLLMKRVDEPSMIRFIKPIKLLLTVPLGNRA